MPKLGAHMSIAGGLPRAVDRAEASGCQALQIFTKSAGQWRARDLPPEEIALFQKQNAAYRAKFGFPFVICARLNKKEAILAGFEKRLKNSPEQEIQTALEEIFKIAELRLRDLTHH